MVAEYRDIGESVLSDSLKNSDELLPATEEVEANIIHGGTTSLKNLTKCIHQVGVDIDQIVYTGYAAAEAVFWMKLRRVSGEPEV